MMTLSAWSSKLQSLVTPLPSSTMQTFFGTFLSPFQNQRMATSPYMTRAYFGLPVFRASTRAMRLRGGAGANGAGSEDSGRTSSLAGTFMVAGATGFDASIDRGDTSFTISTFSGRTRSEERRV